MSEAHDARRAGWPGPFVACGAILLIAAVGLQPTVAGLIRHYSKKPIALRKPLDAIDLSRLPSFRHLPGDGSFRKGFLHSSLDGAGTDDVLRLVFEPIGSEGEGDVMLFVTYYSDSRDQVPHTPEVCYGQAGAVVRSIDTLVIDVPGLEALPVPVEARLLEVTPVVAGADKVRPDDRWRQAVLYVFICNGDFYHDRERVRWAIGQPGGGHLYHSKVEVVAAAAPGQRYEDAVERCTRLFAEALPVLVRDHYPTRAQLE